MPWRFETPPGLRDAIVRAYVPNMAKGSDLLYKEEHSYTLASTYKTKIEDRELLVEALVNNGVNVSKIQSANEFHGQGAGNYSVITLEQIEEYYTTTIFISDLGRFVARDIVWFQQDHSYSMIDDELGLESQKRLSLCRNIVTQIGFYWLESKLLRHIVPGLNLRCFGRLKPLPICELLYFWEA